MGRSWFLVAGGDRGWRQWVLWVICGLWVAGGSAFVVGLTQFIYPSGLLDFLVGFVGR